MDPTDDESEEAKKIRHFVLCFFDGSTADITENKNLLFTYPNDMEDMIVPHFHPSFEPLKKIVLGWWDKLWIAYKYRIWPMIHDQFLEELEKTLGEMEKLTSSLLDVGKAEIE